MNELNELIELAEGYSAHNYHPLPLVVTEAEGAKVKRRGRPALPRPGRGLLTLNFGHRHPELLQAARTQLERVTLDQPGHLS